METNNESFDSAPNIDHSTDDERRSFFDAPSSENEDFYDAHIVGPPPEDYSDDDEEEEEETEGLGDLESARNMASCDDEHDEHGEHDMTDPYDDFFEEMPEDVRNESVQNDEDVLDCSEYTNENIQSLLSSALLSDGLKLRSGYTPDEISDTTKKLLDITLDQITELLLGYEKFDTLRNKSKVEWAHELVKAGWLTYKDGKFFPIVDPAQIDLVKHIVRGAEAAERQRDRCKQTSGEYKSEEKEIRAMKTYNMFYEIIVNICNERRATRVSYQDILDAYNKMIDGSAYADILKRFESLNLQEHPKLNPEWYKHFTDRHSLKKFVEISQFSNIQSSDEDNVPYFSIRENSSIFRKDDFEKVREKWREPQERKPYNRPGGKYDKAQPRAKKEYEPDPNYKPIHIDFDDYDDDDNQPGPSGPKFIPAPFTGDDGFGGRPPTTSRRVSDDDEADEEEEEEEKKPSSSSKISRPLVTGSYQSDSTMCTESETSDGEYSDDDEETKAQRKIRHAEKAARKERRRQRREKKEQDPSYEKRTATVGKMSKTAFDTPPKQVSRKKSSSEESSQDDEKNSTRRTRKTFPTTSALPVTTVDGSLKIQSKSARPQVPHEPSSSQMRKNREDDVAHAHAILNKKGHEDEEEDEEDREVREYQKRKEQEKAWEREAERKRQEEEDFRLASSLGRQFEEQIQKEQWTEVEHDRSKCYNPPEYSGFASSNKPVDPPIIHREHSRGPSYEAPGSSSASQRNGYRERTPVYQNQGYPQNDQPFYPPNFHQAPPQSSRNIPCPQPHYPSQSYSQRYENDSNYSHSRNNMDYGHYATPSNVNNAYYAEPPTSQQRSGFSYFSEHKRQYEAERCRSTAGSVVDVEKLRRRILNFIREQDEDGQLTTDKMFLAKFPNKLPPNFDLYDFVSRNMRDDFIIREVNNEHAYFPRNY